MCLSVSDKYRTRKFTAQLYFCPHVCYLTLLKFLVPDILNSEILQCIANQQSSNETKFKVVAALAHL